MLAPAADVGRVDGPVDAPFDTVLVANRGEIAVRIIRTLRRLGLRSVAVYSDADRGSRHVLDADDAVRLGPPPPRDSYLDGDRIIAAARQQGAGAIHPGYGFLSEDPDFATAVTDAGLVFVGPTPDQLRLFGLKHTARAAAAEGGVPLLPGTDLLADADAAVAAAESIGYPVMLKSTGGGGGIGMLACADAAALRDGFEQVQRIAAASFTSPGLFIERLVTRARHLEVQLFGDGAGRVETLGVRDCSLQRRHQKVVEETPPPGVDPDLLDDLTAAAVRLGQSVRYRSAGTVEFVYDADRQEASFLEVNTRLQVEHPVTEAVWGIDLVEWMVRLAAGDDSFMDARPSPPGGHAIEARVYAEDPYRDHRPGAGLLTEVQFGPDVRVDTWIEAGTEVSAHYDPLLAKVIAHGPDRPTALATLRTALTETRLAGIETSTEFLADLLATPAVVDATFDTATIAGLPGFSPTVEVRRAGHLTTVQDVPGRIGYWPVGVPPSGPMDDRSFRLGNQILGNDPDAAGLECTLEGPALEFATDARICLTGAALPASLDGTPVPFWEPVAVPAGATLDLGATAGPGLRTYLLVAGGIDVPPYLGSRSTFTLGRFGGHGGRALRTGDVLHLDPEAGSTGGGLAVAVAVAEHERPEMVEHWRIEVLEGPHAAPEFFTAADMEMIYATDWKVHHNSSRTGVRLVGPRPQWARTDGGQAGLHPSNIHDTAYAVGAVDFTGDMPIILGPDGPSLGGFVCPATVRAAERWKIGQLRPGDTVRFVPTADHGSTGSRVSTGSTGHRTGTAVVARLGGAEIGFEGPHLPEVCVRRAGDECLLVEFGPMVLDLELRMQVHALAAWLQAERPDGIVELTPGIRSLQIHIDRDRIDLAAMTDAVRAAIGELPTTDDLEVSSRQIHLPLSWDDPATREAIDRYMTGVRADAPWCPWNIEFIRRVNGLDSVDDVRRIVFDASYLVLGLGDVYLGAPVATPLDPRHRLVTTKYNPARTWTPENAVGIGGAYLCIYGMEGPGGYQFVGRTVPVWNTFRTTRYFEPGSPWLLRFFDRIRWYPVEADELLDLRADLRNGLLDLRVEPGTFRLADHRAELAAVQPEIDAFQARQQAAFAAERSAWERSGEFDPRPEPEPTAAVTVDRPTGSTLVESALAATVCKVHVQPGQRVEPGDALVTLEAMKTETTVRAPAPGTVHSVVTAAGLDVAAGSPLVVVRPS